MSTSRDWVLRRAPLVSAVICLVSASFAWAATFNHQISISMTSVLVTSRLTDQDSGTYTRTVTVTLADGSTASRSDVNSYQMGQQVSGTFQFPQPVASVTSVTSIKERFDP